MDERDESPNDLLKQFLKLQESSNRFKETQASSVQVPPTSILKLSPDELNAKRRVAQQKKALRTNCSHSDEVTYNWDDETDAQPCDCEEDEYYTYEFEEVLEEEPLEDEYESYSSEYLNAILKEQDHINAKKRLQENLAYKNSVSKMYDSFHTSTSYSPTQNRELQKSSNSEIAAPARMVKVMSWKYWPKWSTVGTLVVSAGATLPSLIVMNVTSIILTGSCLLLTSVASAFTWHFNKKILKSEGKTLWAEAATKWGKASLPDEQTQEKLLESASLQQPAQWFGEDKVFTLVYNPEKRTYELAQNKRTFNDGDELSLNAAYSMWEAYVKESGIPEQANELFNNIHKTLKRFPMEKLDGEQQHNIQRILRDSIEAVQNYENLSEYTERTDEDLQIVLNVLQDLNEEASFLLDKEIRQARKQLEVHAQYVANRNNSDN